MDCYKEEEEEVVVVVVVVLGGESMVVVAGEEEWEVEVRQLAMTRIHLHTVIRSDLDNIMTMEMERLLHQH
jgi:hypothetical protein